MKNEFEAARMHNIPFSNIRAVFEKVTELQRQGMSPVPFHIGQPDFDTPTHIKQAAKEALDRGITAYTSNYGLPALREAIAEKLWKENSVRVDPSRQIIVTVGTNEAIFLTMLATLNPGDEVLIPDPGWLHYFHCARLCGARPISVPLRMENGFQLDPNDLESLATPRTRMLVINSPHNPTGAVYRPETIQAIASFVEKHQLVLLSDEIYEKMIYNEQGHISPGSIESIQDQTVTVNGFSKIYAMTGWRIGYVAASSQLIDAMIRVHQYTTICATSFAQAGALAALAGPQDAAQQMMQEFTRRRQAVVEGLQAIPGIQFIPPEGAFYVFPRIDSLMASSQQFTEQLIEQYGVAVVPGEAFGEYGAGFIRISFACSYPQVLQGMNAVGRFCRSIQGE